jgi:hypothetical protein
MLNDILQAETDQPTVKLLAIADQVRWNRRCPPCAAPHPENLAIKCESPHMAL